MKLRVALGVSAAWLLIGVVLGSQTALGMNMQGNPVPLGGALRTQLVNSLPWVPATLLAIALAARFPLRRENWLRRVWIHAAAVPVVTWVANVGVVLGFWWIAGRFDGLPRLARQAAFWATIRIHVGVTVYAVSLALTQASLYLREVRARELRTARLETQLARARFQALNEQIRPHFLFNTLHTIGQLWRSGRAEDAEEMLDHLGALFQKVRSSTDRPFIPLAEELTMVREYLAIERARFPDRLTTEVRATAEAGGCVVPPLLLQPLVENAVRHGVSTSPVAGRVTVVGRVEGARLLIDVDDDGPGMDHPPRAPGSGTGLTNTRARLEHAFGEAAALRVESPPGGGTRIRLELPAAADGEAAWNGVGRRG